MTDDELKGKRNSLEAIEQQLENLLGDYNYDLYQNAAILNSEIVIEELRRGLLDK